MSDFTKATIYGDLGYPLAKLIAPDKGQLAELVGAEIDQLLSIPGAWPESGHITIEVEQEADHA